MVEEPCVVNVNAKPHSWFTCIQPMVFTPGRQGGDSSSFVFFFTVYLPPTTGRSLIRKVKVLETS